MSEFEQGLANIMGSFIETELDCVEKQNQEIEQLKQENKQLKEKINTYENPEDLTLMFMYCDEKAKDEIRRLKEEINKISKKELKVMAMLRSIELCTLTKERIDQIEEVMFELDGNNE